MKLTFPLFNATINVPVDDSAVTGKKGRRAVARNKKMEVKNSETETTEKLSETGSADTEIGEQNKNSSDDASSNSVKNTETQTTSDTSTQPLLMVEVVNMTHEKFRHTEEIKVRSG